MAYAVVTSKIPSELDCAVRALADTNGTTRSMLVREALEALVEGRVRFLTREEKRARIVETVIQRDACIGSPLTDIAVLRERLDRDIAALRDASS